MAMRAPPEGSLRHGAADRGSPQETGQEGDAYITAAPVPATPEMLRRGRERFGIFRAPCHGILGTATRWWLPTCPSAAPLRFSMKKCGAIRPGRIYRVIAEGYGLMRSYG